MKTFCHGHAHNLVQRSMIHKNNFPAPLDLAQAQCSIMAVRRSLKYKKSAKKGIRRATETDHTATCAETIPEIVAYTTFPESVLNYKWVLNNARVLLEDIGQGLKSPVFNISFDIKSATTKIHKVTEWYLTVKKSTQGTYSIFLCQDACTCNDYEASEASGRKKIAAPNIWISDCVFSILDSMTNEIKYSSSAPGRSNRIDIAMTNYGVTNFIVKDEFFTGDSLTIQVAATIVHFTDPIESKHEACAIPPDDIRQQMRSLYEEELFTDIIIQCGDKQFKAHKNILASQSPVFKRMFLVDMTEARKNSVEISDIDPLVVSDMLAFLYSGMAPNLETLARDLLIAANKYELPRLGAMCENALKMEMTVANAVELLLHSDLHQATELKKACMEFIRSNTTEIYKSDGWKQLKENSAHDHNYSTLLCELMEGHDLGHDLKAITDSEAIAI